MVKDDAASDYHLAAVQAAAEVPHMTYQYRYQMRAIEVREAGAYAVTFDDRETPLTTVTVRCTVVEHEGGIVGVDPERPDIFMYGVYARVVSAAIVAFDRAVREIYDTAD